MASGWFTVHPSVEGYGVRVDIDLDTALWLRDVAPPQLEQIRSTVMDLKQSIAFLQAEDTELAADVQALGAKLDQETATIADLNTQIAALVASGGASPQDLAALQQLVADLDATHQAAKSHLPPETGGGGGQPVFNPADPSYATFEAEQEALFTFNAGKPTDQQAPSLSFDEVNNARTAAGLEAFPEDQRPA